MEKTNAAAPATGLPFTFAHVALVVLSLTSLTGFAQEPVSNFSSVNAGLPKNQIVATIPLGPQPNAMVVSPDSKFVYVTNFVSTSNTGIVQVIDTATNTITFTINVGNKAFPNTLAITPNGGTLYVTDFDGATVWVIDTATHEVTHTLSVLTAQGVAVSPDGKELYVCNRGNNTVTVIDTATNQISNLIGVGHRAWDVAFTPDGGKAYITVSRGIKPPNGKSHRYLSVVDTATQSVVTTLQRKYPRVPPDNAPTEVTDPNGQQLFVSSERLVTVISTSSNRPIRWIRQTFRHLPATITPDGNYLYMISVKGNAASNVVEMVEIASGKVVGQPIGPLPVPRAVAIAPNGKFAYVFANVSSGGPGGLYVVDISPS
jgi:YVTN family beta-propeller protein